MGEESWPGNVVRSRGVIEADDLSHYWANFGGVFAYRLGETALQEIVHDGPRTVICADCGEPQTDGNVVHMKPAAYAIRYKGETFYLERHIGVSCGCAAKRGLVPPPALLSPCDPDKHDWDEYGPHGMATGRKCRKCGEWSSA